jgi:hypothetical protein
VRSHSAGAAELFRRVAGDMGGGVFLGLPLEGLVCLAEGVERTGWPDEPPILLPTLPPGAATDLCGGRLSP